MKEKEKEAMRLRVPERTGFFGWEKVFDDPLYGAIEALLWASEHPLSIEEIRSILNSEGESYLPQQIGGALRELASLYSGENRGVQLVEVAGGWQFRTNQRYAALIQKLFQIRPPKLSRAALECLSIIAYRQPITRAEIDSIRGVDSSGVVRSLMERNLIEVVGRQNAPGRPYLYGTTKYFLEFFGLKDIHELPSLQALLSEEEGNSRSK